MRRSLEQIERNLINDDRLLLLMLVEEQRETNRLLRVLAGEKDQKEDQPSDEINIDSLKRPELMKLMAQMTEKPPGWNKWETEQIRKHLKGEG